MSKQLTLEDFLITHSNIDKFFIYDFFMIQKIGKDSENEPFTMNLNFIAKWLDIKKGDLTDTIKTYYIENVDYKVVRHNPKNQKKSKKIGKRPTVNIYITTNCFKSLCMRSETPKAEEVRKYYLELEKLVDEYKDYIIKTQEEKITNLEYELKPNKNKFDGYFYIYEVGEYYHTGSTESLNLMFKNNDSLNSQTIRPIIRLKVNDPLKLNSCVNNLLNQYRTKKNKDFFKMDFITLISIIKDCGAIVDKYKCTDCNIKLNSDNLTDHLHNNHNNYNGIFYFSL